MPRIDGYPAAEALTGSEVLPLMQGGATKSATPTQLAQFVTAEVQSLVAGMIADAQPAALPANALLIGTDGSGAAQVITLGPGLSIVDGRLTVIVPASGTVTGSSGGSTSSGAATTTGVSDGVGVLLGVLGVGAGSSGSAVSTTTFSDGSSATFSDGTPVAFSS